LIKLPNFKKTFDYENDFYLSCNSDRIAKFAAHYELFKLSEKIQGDIIECGIFKGASFSRFAMFREISKKAAKKKIIGFDTFGKFPNTKFKKDDKSRKNFIKVAGANSISTNQLSIVLKNKGITKKIELIKGNITKTIPEYVKSHPKLKISLVNLDTDIYEPAVTILEHLYPRISKGGILILDDYKVFPGETKAVNDYFRDKKVTIKKFPFSKTPHYIIKK
jgi:hypothetical protein